MGFKIVLKTLKEEAVKSVRRSTTQVTSVQFQQRWDAIFGKLIEPIDSCCRYFKKPSMWTWVHARALKNKPVAVFVLMFSLEERYPPIILNYWRTTPFSWGCSVAPLCCSAALCQTQTGGHCLRFVSPHERSSRWILSPSILSSSLSLEWVMQYWNHMPSWIPHGSSHLVLS